MKPDEFAKRVIFQKVKVFGTSRDKDPQATADKAKRMLAAVDQNAGGKLTKVQGAKRHRSYDRTGRQGYGYQGSDLGAGQRRQR